MITIPQRTKDWGISPNSLRTFSERSSILSRVLLFVSISIAQFKLILYKIVICTFFFDE